MYTRTEGVYVHQNRGSVCTLGTQSCVQITIINGFGIGFVFALVHRSRVCNIYII